MNSLREFFELLLTPLRMLFTSPGKLLVGSRRIRALSLPAKVAMLAAVFLVVVWIIFAVDRYYDPEVEHRVYMKHFLIIALLVIAIPLAVYQVLKIWLEEEVSRFPDIDHAWRVGMDELAKQGVDIGQTPVYLVLGSNGESQERALFQAAQLPFSVTGNPAGPSALRWFAGPEAIFLVCSDVGALSKLASMARGRKEFGQRRGGAKDSAPENLRGTAIVGATPAPMIVKSEVTPPGPALNPIIGTMMVSLNTSMALSEGMDTIPHQPAPSVTLGGNEAELQRQRLAHLCHLLNRRREPQCPINGAVVLFPLDLINDSQKDELEFAAKSDTRLLSAKLKMVCPLVVLVTGMEQDSGFREFMKRLGREKAATARFGKGTGDGSRAWNRSTQRELEALSKLACAAFEDFVYDLFKSRGALSKPGNTQLYKLLCTIRNNVAGPLERVLTNAFALKDDELADGFIVASCYFAGTGDTEDRQAYIKGVLASRLIEELDEVLEWSPNAEREERRFAMLAQAMFWCDALMLVSLVIIVMIKLSL